MPLRITQVDAFTNRPFTGNPATVCILEELPEDWWMQDVAREMNLSETAFVLPHEDGYDLRWFTPTTEVDLCGHATLAAAHVLWEDGLLAHDAIANFHTRSGLLAVSRRGEWIELDFPSLPAEEMKAPEGLVDALGVDPIWFGQSKFDCLVQLSDEKQVRTLHPDLTLLRRVEARGVIVTSVATANGYDYASRFFAPQSGIDEDPVTGSAHCVLGPFWSDRLERNDLVGYQVSARGGQVRTSVRGDRVILGGQAITVMRGELL